MKSSRIFKGGTILLVIALAVGVFALVVWADGNGTYGMGRKANAPDDDGDGIPNGQDSDYMPHDCEEECDGSCDSVPKGSGMRRNSSDNISELQAHVSGREMKTISFEKLAQIWGVDANQLLEEIKNEFKLTQEYNINSTIDDLRGEYRFSPYQIMEIAQRIKTTSSE